MLLSIKLVKVKKNLTGTDRRSTEGAIDYRRFAIAAAAAPNMVHPAWTSRPTAAAAGR